MATPITFRGSPAQFRRLMGDLVRGLAGKDATVAREIIDGIKLRVGVALLSQVHQAFVVKSRGGTGSDGIKWKPLKAATVAQRKRTAKDVAAAKRAIKAAAKAGRKKPKVAELYGGRQHEILVDTRRLFRSLSPATSDPSKPTKVKDQIIAAKPAAVEVGTNVDYASTHQNGTAHVPARPLWPQDGTVPRAWQPPIMLALQTGLIAAVILLASRER